MLTSFKETCRQYFRTNNTTAEWCHNLIEKFNFNKMKIYHLQNPKCLTIFHTNLTSLKIGTEVLYPTHKMCRSYIIKSMMVSLLKTSKSQIFLRFEQQLLWCIYKSPNSFMSICLCTVVRFFDNTKKHMLKRGVNVVAWTFHLTSRNIFPFVAETHKNVK